VRLEILVYLAHRAVVVTMDLQDLLVIQVHLVILDSLDKEVILAFRDLQEPLAWLVFQVQKAK
jgi:hypothetical protein